MGGLDLCFYADFLHFVPAEVSLFNPLLYQLSYPATGLAFQIGAGRRWPVPRGAAH